MSECLILNDASLPFASQEDCKINLNSFFEVLHKANSYHVNFYRADNCEGDWNSLIYADGFDIGRWINDIQDQDRMRLVKSVLSNVKCPLITTENLENLLFVLSADKDIEVQALGVASIKKSYAISVASHSNWMQNSIGIIRLSNDGENYEEEEVNVSNICSLDHLNATLNKFKDKKQLNKDYLCGLTTQGNIDFPNIIFCDGALKNLRANSITSTDFNRIIDVLEKLNRAIITSRNRDDLKSKSGLNISKESSETMNVPKHARRRKFKHPNLGDIIFEDHVKNFPGAKRMHILADYTNNTICIGYFGRHLSTVSQAT